MPKWTVLEYSVGYILLSLMLRACAGYAYRVNSQLSDDDPKKKYFDPRATNLVLITWPVLAAGYALYYIGLVVLFIIKALLYGIFLILFTLALIFIRKPFLFIWLEKMVRKIGNMLLIANTLLLRIIQPPRRGPQPT